MAVTSPRRLRDGHVVPTTPRKTRSAEHLLLRTVSLLPVPATGIDPAAVEAYDDAVVPAVQLPQLESVKKARRIALDPPALSARLQINLIDAFDKINEVGCAAASALLTTST